METAGLPRPEVSKTAALLVAVVIGFLAAELNGSLRRWSALEPGRSDGGADGAGDAALAIEDGDRPADANAWPTPADRGTESRDIRTSDSNQDHLTSRQGSQQKVSIDPIEP
ncbi:hypothetical protein [Streptomyces anulatus]|uniref:hypothetical protein n=1 Tax=Streptomyces anulatus TaxID=1892 RepID=UPI0033DABB6E